MFFKIAHVQLRCFKVSIYVRQTCPKNWMMGRSISRFSLNTRKWTRPLSSLMDRSEVSISVRGRTMPLFVPCVGCPKNILLSQPCSGILYVVFTAPPLQTKGLETVDLTIQTCPKVRIMGGSILGFSLNKLYVVT